MTLRDFRRRGVRSTTTVAGGKLFYALPGGMLSTMFPKRRSVLQSLPFLPLAAFAADTRSPKVAVSGLEIFRVHVNRRGDWVIARLRTGAPILLLSPVPR